MNLEPGVRIGPYKILRRLGRGTTGVVYHATHPEHGDVALKTLTPEVAADENARGRFVREAQTLVRLRHRNIVTVFEGGVYDDVPFIAMELLSGTTLAARLASSETTPLERKLDIVIQLCDGLQYAHEHGVVHRDVKPANVWVMKNGGVKLLDFGTARVLGSTVTRGGALVGSAAYMAPEQLAGSDVDGRADVFAAGGILYELLAGRRAFEAEGIAAVMNKILLEAPVPLDSIVPGIPADIVRALDTALQKDVALRYQEAAEFGTDLRLARYGLDADDVSSAITVESRAPVAAPAALDTGTVVIPRAARITPESTPTISVGGEAVPMERGPEPAPRPPIEAVPAVPAPPGTAVVWRRAAMAVGGVAVLLVAALLMLPGPTADPAVPRNTGSVPAGAAIVGGAQTPGRLVRVESMPSGARIVIDGRETGLLTPADVPVAPGASPSLLVQAGDHSPAEVRLTDALLAKGVVNVVLEPSRRRAADVRQAGGGHASADGHGASGAGEDADGPALPGSGGTSLVGVHAAGSYPFALTGCGRSSAAAVVHDLQVDAPCTLRLRAPKYYLDETREITASAGRVEFAAPGLARVQLRSKHEGCTLLLNDNAVGSPPVDLELAAGTYRVVIQCRDRTYSIRALTIEPGQSSRRLDDFLR